MKITLDTIAKRAGVNKTTVSKALRNSPDINRETAARIRRIAAECGYRKKPKRSGSDIVGIICPEIKSEYYSRIVELLNETFFENGYNCLVMLSGFEAERERGIVDLMAQNRVLGIVCITESDESNDYLVQTSKEKNIPIIQVAVNVNGANIDSICINDSKCICYAVRHLAELGHRKIAFFGDRFTGARLEYFALYARENGIYDERFIFIDRELRHFECGYKLMGDLLALDDRPTAIIAEYDNIALGAMRRLAEEGYLVPEDFSVIGCDNSAYTPYLSTALTTIDGHNEELCEIVVAIMMRKINDITYNVVQSVRISPDLVVRQTTGPLKARQESYYR